MPILCASHLKKYYGKDENLVKALDNVNVSVDKGQFVAVIGTSGSGKSTLLNMLGGLDVPTSGSVQVEDQSIEKMSEEQLTVFRRRRIGFIFQNYNLIPYLTAYENIVLPVRLDGKKEDKGFLKEIVQFLELDKKLQNYPSHLSGGQQQRVAIARALVKMPRVLLLDEPLSNLDARLRLQTREEIRRIQKQTQITTIFVTHDQDEAMSISDIIVVMKDGVVQQIGRPQEVYDNPVNLFVAKFLGTPPINVFQGAVRNEQLYIGKDSILPVKGVADQEVSVGIRPEGFLLQNGGPLCCHLNRIEVMGRDISVVSTHECCEAPAIRSIINAENIVDTSSETVRFAVRPHKIFLFHKDTGERILFPLQIRVHPPEALR